MNGKNVHIYLEDRFSSLNGIDEIKSWPKETEKNPIIYLFEKQVDISKLFFYSNDISISFSEITISDVKLYKDILNVIENKYPKLDLTVNIYINDFETVEEIVNYLNDKNINIINLNLIFESEELSEEQF